MKRKRFIRLLMSCYYQRNEAQAIADAHQKAGCNYAQAWDCMKYSALQHMPGWSMKKATKAIHTLTDAIALIGVSASGTAKFLREMNAQIVAVRHCGRSELKEASNECLDDVTSGYARWHEEYGNATIVGR